MHIEPDWTQWQEGKISKFSLPLDFSCAAMEPRTDEIITRKMPNQGPEKKWNWRTVVILVSCESLIPSRYVGKFIFPLLMSKLEMAWIKWCFGGGGLVPKSCQTHKNFSLSSASLTSHSFIVNLCSLNQVNIFSFLLISVFSLPRKLGLNCINIKFSH